MNFNISYVYFHFLPPRSGVFQSYTAQPTYKIGIQNNGVNNIAKSLQDELESSGMFIVDENKKIDVMEEAGYEAKWAQFLNEAKDVDFNVIKAYIKNWHIKTTSFKKLYLIISEF